MQLRAHLPLLILGLMLLAQTACSAEADWLREGRDAHAAKDWAALATWVAGPAPGGIPEDTSRKLRQDGYFRLAAHALDDGRPAQALAYADAGLALAPLRPEEQSDFTANLYVAKGRALEALGHSVDASSAFLEAIRINESLMERELSRGKAEAGAAP